MHWTKVRRARRLKRRLSEYNSASQPYLTYEEMLEIAAERERANDEPYSERDGQPDAETQERTAHEKSD